MKGGRKAWRRDHGPPFLTLPLQKMPPPSPRTRERRLTGVVREYREGGNMMTPGGERSSIKEERS